MHGPIQFVVANQAILLYDETSVITITQYEVLYGENTMNMILLLRSKCIDMKGSALFQSINSPVRVLI